MAEILKLGPSPTDLATREILNEFDWCPSIPESAINVFVLEIKKPGRTIYELTWRAVNQFDDELSGGKPEVGITRLKIDPEYAADLISIGVPQIKFHKGKNVDYHLRFNLRPGM